VRLPEYVRKFGKVKPTKSPIVETVAQAKKHIASQGGTVEPDNPHDGPRHLLKFRGFSHGGLTDEALIHIADEDARAVARKRVLKPKFSA